MEEVQIVTNKDLFPLLEKSRKELEKLNPDCSCVFDGWLIIFHKEQEVDKIEVIIYYNLYTKGGEFVKREGMSGNLYKDRWSIETIEL